MKSIFDLETANADFVTDYLAIGGDLSEGLETAAAEAVELAEVALITHILDVRMEAKETLWEHFPGVQYRWDGIDDAGQKVPAEWFERITDWADAAINAGGTVLTHCHMGINRGPSAGYAVLLRRGWDPVQAIDAIRTARPQAFVAYAENALDWHFTRTGATPIEKRSCRTRLAEWRLTHPMDLHRAIRNGGRRSTGLVA
ncbi:hypothetical protein BH09ACT6_BH09ACT6_15460 [soil metagenome]